MNKIFEMLKVPEGISEITEAKPMELLEEKKEEIKEEDYRIKQLRRIP